MGLNVSVLTNGQLENYGVLKNVAKDILSRKSSPETTQKIIDKALFTSDYQMKDLYSNAQLAVLKASYQVTLAESNKKTIQKNSKDIQTHLSNKRVFGELWNEYISSIDDEYVLKNELYDFNVNYNAKNIFAA